MAVSVWKPCSAWEQKLQYRTVRTMQFGAPQTAHTVKTFPLSVTQTVSKHNVDDYSDISKILRHA